MKFSLAWGFPMHHPSVARHCPITTSPLQPIHIYIIVIETSISFHHHRTYSFLPTTSLLFILWPCITTHVTFANIFPFKAPLLTDILVLPLSLTTTVATISPCQKRCNHDCSHPSTHCITTCYRYQHPHIATASTLNHTTHSTIVMLWSFVTWLTSSLPPSLTGIPTMVVIFIPLPPFIVPPLLLALSPLPFTIVTHDTTITTYFSLDPWLLLRSSINMGKLSLIFNIGFLKILGLFVYVLLLFKLPFLIALKIDQFHRKIPLHLIFPSILTFHPFTFLILSSHFSFLFHFLGYSNFSLLHHILKKKNTQIHFKFL